MLRAPNEDFLIQTYPYVSFRAFGLNPDTVMQDSVLPRRRSIHFRASPLCKQTARNGTRLARASTSFASLLPCERSFPRSGFEGQDAGKKRGNCQCKPRFQDAAQIAEAGIRASRGFESRFAHLPLEGIQANRRLPRQVLPATHFGTAIRTCGRAGRRAFRNS